MFCFSRNKTSYGTCAIGLFAKMSLPYRGCDLIRGINPSARTLTGLISLKKHTHPLTYNIINVHFFFTKTGFSLKNSPLSTTLILEDGQKSKERHDFKNRPTVAYN